MINHLDVLNQSFPCEPLLVVSRAVRPIRENNGSKQESIFVVTN